MPRGTRPEPSVGHVLSEVVTQPRRFAALSVARRVAEERGEEVGDTVGCAGMILGYSIRFQKVVERYMVRGETKMNQQRCQLLFCTLGVLLRRLISQGSQQMFLPLDMTHLVLDEVHERSMDMDFVLTLLRHALPSRPKLKVLLMSATMDTKSLSKLFLKMPPVLKIPGRTFPVEVVHLEQVEDLLGTTYAWSGKDGVAGTEGREELSSAFSLVFHWFFSPVDPFLRPRRPLTTSSWPTSWVASSKRPTRTQHGPRMARS